jgi:hypothetical protein
MVPRRIKVTFAESFPVEVVEGLFDTNFLESGTVYRGDMNRVIFLRPAPSKYELARDQLLVWQQQGALSFDEET